MSESAGAQCRELYGRLEDSASATGRLVICNSEHRVEQLLVSRGHIVRVWLDHDTGQRSQRRFLIHYSGMVHDHSSLALCVHLHPIDLTL